jgi:hypothetical protein
METNFTPWNDQLEIEGDAREDVANSERMEAEFLAEEEAHYREEKALFHGDGNSFEDNLTTPEDIAEFEAWLDGR